jgi:DNA-binding response OmpR family regulator
MLAQMPVREYPSPLPNGVPQARPFWGIGGEPMVMVVEDHEDTRECMRLLFETEGFLVTERQDGRSTFDAIVQTRPDAVILNGRLCGEDGWSICRRLRAAEDATIRDTPVIFVSTARGDGESKAFSAGCDVFVVKPFDIGELVVSVTALIAQRRAVPRTSAPPKLAMRRRSGSVG